jgi:hypothetical protein
VLDEEHCVCIPVPPEPEPPPPEPEPPGGAVPENYLTLTRAQDIIDYQNSKWEGLELELRANHFAGYIDPAYVASNCGWSCRPFFGTSAWIMTAFSETGAALEAEGERLMENLGRVNRRCVASHPEHDPRFCGRSEVRREVWNAFEAAFLDHKDTWSAWRDAVSPDNCPALASQLNANGKPERWDSQRGWCRKMGLHGLRSCQ